jgi:predicted acyl esterase
MLRGVKRKLIKFSDTQEQEVIYVQTPQLAHKQPEPETSNAAVIDTFEGFSEVYKRTIGFLESVQFGPPEPKSFFIQDGIICDQDVTIVMPDGAKLYADIYRSVTVEKFPVILCWSPYGKNQLKVIPSPDGKWNVCGVAEDAVSIYTKFESDPCYWCNG